MRNKKRIVSMLGILIVLLSTICMMGCASFVKMLVESGAAAKKILAPNKIFLHSNPQVGDFITLKGSGQAAGSVEYESKSTREYKITEINGDMITVTVTTYFNSASSSVELLDEMAVTTVAKYVVDFGGNVKEAYFVTKKGKEIALRILQPGMQGYFDFDYASLPITKFKDKSGVETECYVYVQVIDTAKMLTEMGQNPAFVNAKGYTEISHFISKNSDSVKFRLLGTVQKDFSVIGDIYFDKDEDTYRGRFTKAITELWMVKNGNIHEKTLDRRYATSTAEDSSNTKTPSNHDVNAALLNIDRNGTVTGVTDKKRLKGKLVLPATVKNIDKETFRDCTGLTSVDLSPCTNLTEIGKQAFENCTGLTEVIFPANLTKINWKAFEGCTGLTDVNLPANLSKISGAAFSRCSNLHTLTVDPANTTYCSKENIIYTRDMKTLVCAARAITQISIPNTVTDIDAGAFWGCAGLAEVIFPTTLAKIYAAAFTACTSLTEVSLPTSLTEIGKNAFWNCKNLRQVDLSTCINLTEISEATFYGCTSLTEVRLPASLTKISGSVFYGSSNLHTVTVDPANPVYCSKDNVIYTKDMKTLVCAPGDTRTISIPETVTEIGSEAFQGRTELTEVDFSDCINLTTIGKKAFGDCTGLTEINFPRNLTIIGTNAFESCTGLTNIDLAFTNVFEIDGYAFTGCTGLTSVDLAECSKLTKIGWGAFKGCTGLMRVHLPINLTEIAGGAFSKCTNLTTISFPASLTSIGESAFSGCTSLTAIDFFHCTSIETIGTKAFDGTPTRASFFLPEAKERQVIIKLLRESGLNVLNVW